jgi:hypothetical protein
MFQLILHHHYTFGSTFDISTFGNHGQPHLVTAGTAAFASSLHFQQSDSRITVAPAQSLNNPFAIAAMVRFYADGAMTARQNLVEGFMSFSFYVEPSGALTGTIVDANNLWTGTTSPASLVKPGAWHEAWLVHDGVSQLALQCDGVTVAVARNVYGPVRSVGNLGVAIGNWPDRGQYPFAGYIDEVKLYRWDPSKDLQNLLNPCCFDGKAFDAVLAELKANKVLNESGGYWQLLQQLARLLALLRGNSLDGTRMVNQIGEGLYRALQARDSANFAQLQGNLAKMAPTDAATAKEIATLESSIKGTLDKAGVSSDLFTRLTAAMCLQAFTTGTTDGGKR